MQFAEITLLYDPMVHLDVDVGVIITVPWSAEGVRPQSLKIRRQTSLSAAGNHQISSEVII